MRRLKSLARILLAIPLCVSTLYSQATWDRLQPFTQHSENGRVVAHWSADDLHRLSTTVVARSLVSYMMNRRLFTFAHRRFMQSQADQRVDQQVVAGSTGGGTGDPVAMPGLPDFLAYAVSTGVVSQTVNQNVVTFSANGDGLYRFIAGQNPACPQADQAANDESNLVIQDSCTPPSWANNLSIAAAFNVATSTQNVTGQSTMTGSTQAALASVNAKDFSSATLRYAPSNTRSPKSPQSLAKFQAKMNDSYLRLQGPGQRLVEYLVSLGRSDISTIDFVGVLRSDLPTIDIDTLKSKIPTLRTGDVTVAPPIRVFDAWHVIVDTLDQQRDERSAPSTSTEESFLSSAMNTYLDVLRAKDPAFDTKVEELTESYIRYLTRNAVTASDQVYSPMVTADYTFSRPPLEPDLHTFTFVFSLSPGAKSVTNPLTITANVGAGIYAKPQPSDTKGNTSTLRNMQAAFQLDRSWKASQTPIQLSLGGYFQYQINPGIINVPSGSTIPGTSIMVPGNAMTLLAPKGFIGVAESKVTLHIPGVSIPIPLGFSYSNRTDLLKGSEVRAHIAFSFDTFSLASNKNP